MQSQKGFSLLIGIIIIVAVLLAIGGGYWWWQTSVKAPWPTPQLIGGDKDSHGCLPAAGYTWCALKNKCLRTWEEKCEITAAQGTPLITSLSPNKGPIGTLVLIKGNNIYTPKNVRIIFKKTGIGENSIQGILDLDSETNNVSFQVPKNIMRDFTCPEDVICSPPPPMQVTPGVYEVKVSGPLGDSNTVSFTVTN